MLVVNDSDLQLFLKKKFKKIRITTTFAIIKKLLSLNFQVEIIPNFQTILHKDTFFHIHSNLFSEENT